MFERFTRNARAVVVGAQQAAARAGASEVRPPHLLESLAATDSTLAMRVLAGPRRGRRGGPARRPRPHPGGSPTGSTPRTPRR